MMYNVYTNHSMLQFGSSQHEDAKIPILMKTVCITNERLTTFFMITSDNEWDNTTC